MLEPIPITPASMPLQSVADKSVEMPAVPITMIGTGPGTNLSGTTAVTQEGSPNLVVTVIGPIMAVLVRFLHLYGVTMVGIISAGMTPWGAEIIPYTDFFTLVKHGAVLSISVPALGALKDIVTIFARLEGRFPLLTGNI